MLLLLALNVAADPTPPSPPTEPVPSTEPAPTLYPQLLSRLADVAPALVSTLQDLKGGSRTVEPGAPSRSKAETHGPCKAETASRFWKGAIRVIGPFTPPNGLSSTLWMVQGEKEEAERVVKLSALPAGNLQFRLDVESNGICRTADVLQQSCDTPLNAAGECTRCPPNLSGDLGQLCRAADYAESLRYFDLWVMAEKRDLHPEVRAYVQAALKGGELK